MEKTQIIGMAEMGVVRAPQHIATLGLGSCVGIVLYDPTTKIGGMVHVVMPDSKNQQNVNYAKFADTGPAALLQAMMKIGARRQSVVAKLVGGAHMFGSITQGDTMKIGERNSFNSKMAVLRLKIRIVAEDLRGTYGRTIELDAQTGDLMVKTVGRGVKVL